MKYLILVLAIAMAFGDPAAAVAEQADPSARTTASIIADRAELDGTTVTFEGEVVGEALRADDGSVWLSVLAGGTAIGVYLPTEMAADITLYGDYSHTGDSVRVTGDFNLACDQHGGDLDVHGTSLEVIARGSTREHSADLWKAGLAAAGFSLAGASALYSRRRRRAGPGE